MEISTDRLGLTKEPRDDGRCEVIVQEASGWHYHRCMNKAKTTINGVHYCSSHDPIKKAAIERDKEIKEIKKYNEESAKREYTWYANKYCIMQGLTIKDLKSKCK